MWNAQRHLLAGNNGKTLNCDTGKLVETHWGMYNTMTLPWALTEWEHPCAREYRAVVGNIIKYWKEVKPSRPDLQIIRGPAPEATEDLDVNCSCQLACC